MEGKRPEITDDTPEFYADIMEECWDPNPENRPTALEIWNYLSSEGFEEGKEINESIELAELKRQEIIKSEKYLIDEKNHKNHPESFYTSRALSKLIEKANSLKISSNKPNQQDDTSINNLSASQFLN